MAKVRLNMEVTEDLVKFLDNLADKEGTTKTELVRRAISVLKAFDQQRQAGNTHIGFAADANCLDSEIVGILDSDPDPAKDAKGAQP